MLLTNADQVRRLNELLEYETHIVIDLETTGLWAYRGDRILTVSMYLPEAKMSFTMPINQGDTLFAACPLVDIQLVDWDRVNQCTVIMHNGKFDMSFLDAAGANILGINLYDTLHAQFLLNNLEPVKALKALTADIESNSPEWRRWAPENLDLDLARDTAGLRANLSVVDMSAVVAYAETDCVLTWILYARQQAADWLNSDNKDWLIRRESLVSRVTLGMERRGLGWHDDNHQYIKSNMESVLIRKRQGIPFDPMSSNALRNVFGSDKYDKQTLRNSGLEIAEQVIDFRETQHDYGTFVVKIAECVSADGVLHPNYRQNGTNTGRFSSNKPNILGLPKRMRGQFCPRDSDMEYVSYDLTQIELAMCAWYSNCTPLLDTLAVGGDVHKKTADMIGVDRQIGKRLNFSMVYGVGADTMAERMEVSPEQARRWIADFRRAYPELVASKMRCESAARRNGYLRLWNGHYRYVPEVHKAWSYLIQSAVAELAKDIMIYLFQWANNVGGFLVLHVHDEFVLELPKGREDLQAEAEDIICAQGPEGLVYHCDKSMWDKEV